MTFIKALELHGFKSFAHKTALNFPQGFNMVVGSNGSGKSNILDALCFVLGKMSKKGMRAEKLNDLIFNGGKSGKSAKTCSVKIIFDNAKKIFPYEGGDFSITRVANKDGKSLYKINDNTVKREEILNALNHANLNPDGYNIILQGDIQKFVDLSPEQRRETIQEISGISIYEQKKHKSLLELGKVDDKLKEANAVLAERERYLKELIDEKKHAEQFLKLKAELHELKANFIFKRIHIQETDKQDVESKLNATDESIKEIEGKIEALRNDLLSRNEELTNVKVEIESKGHAEQTKLQEEVESLRARKLILENDFKNFEGELKRISDRRLSVKTELQGFEDSINKKKIELKGLASDVKLRNEELAKLKKTYSLEGEVDYLKIQNQIQSIDEELLSKKQKAMEVKQARESMKAYDNIVERLSNAKNDLGRINKKISELADKQSEATGKLSEVEAYLEGLNNQILHAEAKRQANYDYAKRGVREILKVREQIKGVHGALSELGVVNKRYAQALSVAAGGRIHSIVVSDDYVAEQCIDYLKRNQSGRASFMPLNKIQGLRIDNSMKVLKSKPGVIDFAINLINFDEKHRRAFELALGNTLVINDIQTSRSIGIGAIRMVTVDGDLIETTGLMTGGWRDKDSNSFLEEGADKASDELLSNKTKYERFQTELREAINGYNDEIMAQRERRAGSESLINELSAKVAELEPLTKQSMNYELLIDEIKNLESRRGELKPKAEARIDESKLSSVKNSIEGLTGVINGLIVDKNTIESELNNVLLKEEDKLKKILIELDKDKIRFTDDLSKSKTDLRGVAKELKDKEDEEKKFYGALNNLYSQRDSLEKLATSIGKEESGCKDKIYKLKESTNSERIKLAGINAKLEGLHVQFKDYSNVETKLLRKSVEEISDDINKLDARVQGFGNVNLKALEAYDEAKKDYDVVKNKSEQLLGEKQEIMNIIESIEDKKKESFVTTFNKVSQNFGEIFATLSPGGIAKMYLDNQDNPFEGGIEITARPKGKKILTLKSMSGGEKTITALAFIFSIQEFEPAPFYIMDEVDAALDKSNSEMLSQLLKNYSSSAQFIVISHNDDMISQADYLFGVSMNPEGLSSIVSLKLPE